MAIRSPIHRGHLELLERRAMLHGLPQLVGDASLSPPNDADFAWLGNEVFFPADDGTGDVELWKSDGTPDGTVMVKDIRSGSQGSLPRDFVVANGVVLFTAYDDELGRELWMTDGTPSGTRLLRDHRPGTLDSTWSSPTSVGDNAFFVNEHRGELWVSDGTEAGTSILGQFSSEGGGTRLADLTSVGQRLFFSNDDTRAQTASLYVSDGTKEGTAVVKKFGGGGSIANFVDFGGKLVFTSFDERTGRDRLWRSDGTEAGTIAITATKAAAFSLVAAEEFAFFGAWTGSQGGLWRTDGTVEGTMRLKDFGSNEIFDSLTSIGDTVFFRDHDQLWKSDGTKDGTMPVEQIANPVRLREVNNILYVVDADERLWRTDGTAEGTRFVEFDSVPDGSNPWALTGNDGTTLFWSAAASSQGLWKATENDTTWHQLHADIVGPSGGSIASRSSAGLIDVNGEVFFRANNGQLWQTDGSRSWRVEDIDDCHNCGHESDPLGLTNLNGTSFFTNEKGNQTELWKGDGTSENSEVVAVLPGIGRILATTDEHLFLGVGDRQLWTSDGTTEGTYQVADNYQSLAISGGEQLFFLGADEETGAELWRSDGTVEGTRIVKDIAPGGQGCGLANVVVHDGELYFSAVGGLWTSDGTDEGTTLVKSGDFVPVRSGRDVVYLVGNDPSTGRELWQSDGTEEGTVLIHDVNPGAADSIKYRSTATAAEINGRLYFTADDGFHGKEIWQIPLEQEPLPGDTNGSGTVDFDDFVQLAASFGQVEDAVFSDGDFDGNGTVDFTDFLLLAANFG